MAFKENKYFIPPTEPDIWRYFEDWKFKSLLESDSLFFCRADEFKDTLEGELPPKVISGIRQWYRSDPWGNGKISEEKIEKALDNLVGGLGKMRNTVLVSCWHINPQESKKMWKEYVKNGNGVAIKTTFEGLKKSFEKTTEDVLIGEVRYIEHDKEHWYAPNEFPHKKLNAIIPFIHKDIKFEDERECRALIQLNPNGFMNWENEEIKNGRLFPVDLNTLISEVIVQPGATNEYILSIKRMLESKGLSVTVKRSALDKKP